MEKIKEIVVEYLTKQIENFEQLSALKALPEEERKAKARELHFLMSRAHPYADEQKLKKILFSESQLEAFVHMVQLAKAAWEETYSNAKIVDSTLFVEKITISVLNGMFNPSVVGAVSFV